MLTLEELIQHRDNIDELAESELLCVQDSSMEMVESLDTASKMLSALIYQLENQSVSFTP